MHKRATAVVACAVLVAGLLAGCATAVRSGGEPLTITVWTYYNGEQLTAFQNLIDSFNDTVGKQRGIVVEGSNVGSVDDLRDAVMDSVDGKVGAAPTPNMFMAYADTAYEIDSRGFLADLAEHLTDEERASYIEGYLEEGTLGASGSIKIFPIAKSVEVMAVNKTDFEPFASATGTTYDDLKTFEGVAEVAQRYYEWTDGLTLEPNDGKAFCGRDSLANLFYIGGKQLGVSLTTVQDGRVVLDFDKSAVRRIWDAYYVPYVKGYFNESGRYRSDDVKTGNIISLIGSSSGALFFPSVVVDQQGGEHAIEMDILPCPQFAGGQPYAVQQGAGIAVINKSEEEVAASIEFLKWFTQPEQNLLFSVSSGYLPVMESANSMDAVHARGIGLDERSEKILSVGMAEATDNTLYTPQAFENGTEFRATLEYSLSGLAASNAQKVRERLAAGDSLEKACAPYVSDAAFDEWYEATLAKLEALI